LRKSKRFPSQEYAASKSRRLKRIAARTTVELSEAFAAGKVTLRQYDLISRLAPKQQKERIAVLNREIEGAQIAASTIEEILDRSKGAPDSVRLSEVARVIREAVSGRLQNEASFSTL
jgi:hypothetical protein